MEGFRRVVVIGDSFVCASFRFDLRVVVVVVVVVVDNELADFRPRIIVFVRMDSVENPVFGGVGFEGLIDFALFGGEGWVKWFVLISVTRGLGLVISTFYDSATELHTCR
jgi:hypothetical protein